MQGLRGEFPFCKYGNCCANFQAGAIEKPAAISRLRRAFGLGLAFCPGGYGSPPAATAVMVTFEKIGPNEPIVSQLYAINKRLKISRLFVAPTEKVILPMVVFEPIVSQLIAP